MAVHFLVANMNERSYNRCRVKDYEKHSRQNN